MPVGRRGAPRPQDTLRLEGRMETEVTDNINRKGAAATRRREAAPKAKDNLRMEGRFDGDRASRAMKDHRDVKDEDLRAAPKHRGQKPYMTVTGEPPKEKAKSKVAKPPTPLGRASKTIK